jgi:hypothetical protein
MSTPEKPIENTAASETSEQEKKLFDIGESVDEVSLTINYQIVQHFSQHLYGSPNKAVEELVANSFDAFARRAYIYLPGKFTTSFLIVWDDGDSMDVDGLKGLWDIADSPKTGDERVEKHEGFQDRAIIGKFGIGKLASYSIGNEIIHLCKKDDEFLLVHVDYQDFLEEGTAVPAANEQPHKVPIRKISKIEAETLITGLFTSEVMGDADSHPAGLQRLFDQPHWTVAIIGELKNELKQGRLLWILGNGMPLRPDFEIFVNDEPVTSKLEQNATAIWDFGTAELKTQIENDWKDAKEDVEEPLLQDDLEFGTRKGLDPNEPDKDVPYVRFPYLGDVWCRVRIFENPLNDIRAERIGRSYGFFVMVRGRLINPDDPQYILAQDPHFGTFYRCQYFLYFDKDEDLLADRERFKKDTPGYREMQLLLSSLAKATRSKVYADLEREEEVSRVENLLPVRSSELFRSPMSSVVARTELDEGVTFNFAKPEIKREPNGESEPLASISSDGKGFTVNTSHPYYTVIEERMGKRRKRYEPFFQALDLLSVSEILLRGFMYDVGIPEDKVSQVFEWREDLFRKIADNYRLNKHDLAKRLIETSYSEAGKTEFEIALKDILSDMGFKCERDGKSREKDVLLIATIGPESYKFTFEPKSCNGELANDAAEVGPAGDHRERAGAEFAVIVAREFAGFKANPRTEDNSILGQCKDNGRVSIMTVESIVELHEAIKEFQYPLDLLRDIFTEIESPELKLERIRNLNQPTDGFEYKTVLEEIWRRQSEEAHGELVHINTVRQQNSEWKTKFSEDEFARKVIALASMADGRIIVSDDNKEVSLRQSPDLIVELIERRLNG